MCAGKQRQRPILHFPWRQSISLRWGREGDTHLAQYSGRELSDMVLEGNGVRADGRTLVGQPHVRGDKLWTVEDLKRANCVFADPRVW